MIKEIQYYATIISCIFRVTVKLFTGYKTPILILLIRLIQSFQRQGEGILGRHAWSNLCLWLPRPFHVKDLGNYLQSTDHRYAMSNLTEHLMSRLNQVYHWRLFPATTATIYNLTNFLQKLLELSSLIDWVRRCLVKEREREKGRVIRDWL